MTSALALSLFFFFNDTATTEIYTLSLHDALPISVGRQLHHVRLLQLDFTHELGMQRVRDVVRSEEHTSELQSRPHLVCRLLLEKKKKSGHGSIVVRPTRNAKRSLQITASHYLPQL